MTVEAFTGIELVDAVLRKLAEVAVKGATPKCDVTSGPLDLVPPAGQAPQLNWCLYRVNPHPSYRNMEAPRGQAPGSRGNPPVALQLHYLLSVVPADGANHPTKTEDASRMLGLVVHLLHRARAIVDEQDPDVGALLSNSTLLEPLRITMEPLDLDTLTKLWTAAAKPMRLGVGYSVSLAFIVDDERHAPGPPVLEPPHIDVEPSMGPRFDGITPDRVWRGAATSAKVLGAIGDLTFELLGSASDPTPGHWVLPATPGPDSTYGLALGAVPADLVAGVRPIEVRATIGGKLFARDQAAVAVVPQVVSGTVGPANLASARELSLTTAHVGNDCEAIVNGAAIGQADVHVVSATAVTLTVVKAPSYQVMLRSGGLAGPMATVS